MSDKNTTWTKWIPAAVMVAIIVTAGAVFHRPIAQWFGLNTNGIVGGTSHDPHHFESTGNFQVGVHVDPHKPRVGKNTLLIVLQDVENKPITNASIEAVAEMPAMGSMPSMRAAAPMKHSGNGRYEGEFELTMGGSWPLSITIDTGASGKASLVYTMATNTEGLTLNTKTSGTAATSNRILNDVCPIQGGEVDPETPTVTWKGHTIGFCCPGCDKKWNAWPDKKKQAFVDRFPKTVAASSSPKSVNNNCPILGGEVDPDTPMVTWKGHKIGFCCPGCDKKWNAWSDEKKQAFVDKALKSPSPESGSSNKPKKPLPPADAIAFWTCSMHPSVKSKDKGTCPICKMDLAPVTHEEVRTGVMLVDARRRQLIGLRTTTAIEQNVDNAVHAVGIVEYDETRLTDVSLKYRGWVGKIHADFLGKHVKAGEPLFTIYSPELLSAQQEYLDAVASQSDSSRSNRILESARQRLMLWDMTEEQIESLKKSKQPSRYVPYLSPATGTVIHKMAVQGSAIESGKMVYRIADLSSVWVEAELYEHEIPLIRVGQDVDIRVNYLAGKSYQGKVSYVYPYLHPKTRRGRVRIEVANPKGELRPEMYATVNIRVPMGKRLVIPEEAVLYAGKTNVVFVDLGKDRIRPERVELGARVNDPKLDGRWVEVLKGLKAGDTVVTSGNFLIASESKLKSGIEKW